MATSMQANQNAGTGKSLYRSPTVEDCSDDECKAGEQHVLPNDIPGPLLEERREGQNVASVTETEAVRAVRILLWIARNRDANEDEHWLPHEATPAMHAATAFVAASYYGDDEADPIDVKVYKKLEEKTKSWTSMRWLWYKTLKDLEKRGLPTQNLSDGKMEEGFRLAKRLLSRIPQYSDKDKAIPFSQPDETDNTPATTESETATAEPQIQAAGESTAPAPSDDTSVVSANSSTVTSFEVSPLATSESHRETTATSPEAQDDLSAQSASSDHKTSASDRPDERPASTMQSEPPQTPLQKRHESRASTSAISVGSSCRRRFSGSVGDGPHIGAFPQSPTRSTSDPPRPPRETDPRPQKLADFKLPRHSRFPVNPQPARSKDNETSDPFLKSPARLTDPHLPGNFPQTQDEAVGRTTTSPQHDEPESNKDKRGQQKHSVQKDNKGKCDDQGDARQKGKQNAHAQTQDEATKRTTTSPEGNEPQVNKEKHDRKRNAREVDHNKKSDDQDDIRQKGKEKAHAQTQNDTTKRTATSPGRNTRGEKKSDEQRGDKGKSDDKNDDRQKGKEKAHVQKDASSWHGPLPLSRAPAPAATTQTSEGESSRKSGKRKSDEELRNELLQEQALKRRGRNWEAISGRLFKKS